MKLLFLISILFLIPIPAQAGFPEKESGFPLGLTAKKSSVAFGIRKEESSLVA